ncbi:GNAT family N-acetyltransferase [Octadecabacter sp. G9-8]|uniref:GNAT family N-acetyltransferase n=1 Tax=Octadecabacter dasysiphoniae TaxID=2909341 RepID=A0ABS9CZ15_9RHOB|nr:GNAT family protein [Octadecabacter dasysiphoniae]MCF2872434.1 GNAT family N-acetyltransferase [Octadecabacter dasysiphoniae]
MINTKRPVGPLVEFFGADWPDGRDLIGAYVRLEKVDPARHGPGLWAQIKGHDAVWDYLFEAPPVDEAAFVAGLEATAARDNCQGYTICDLKGAPLGYAFYLGIVPAMGAIEVGNINFSPALQQTPAASEAMYLMMREAFALGYRRYEWKCNALNMPSRRAAQRFGFSWEGIFRQHYVVKGRNRDTAWFAMTDGDWPQISAAFEDWLSPDNFDATGQQRQSLRALTAPCRVASDPAQTD